jgi:hypothetical protein
MAFQKFPSVKLKSMGTGLLGHFINPPKHGQVGKCNIQAVFRDKRNQMHIFKAFNDQK